MQAGAGEQALRIFRAAFGAHGTLIAENKFFKFFGALRAFIFIDWHGVTVLEDYKRIMGLFKKRRESRDVFK